jgi:hypothetical protein
VNRRGGTAKHFPGRLFLAALLGYRVGPVTFFSQMFEELAERRLRLHKAVRAFTAGLIEFAIVGGLFVSLLAIPLGNVFGVLPPLIFFAGYLLLERRRQAALKAVQAADGDEAALRKRSDRQALIFSIVVALVGFGVFGQAMAIKEKEGWVPREPPPSKVYDLEIVK